MKLTIEEFDYPNKAFKWVLVKLDGLEIGRCDKTPQGLVPMGKRKPVAPEKLAEALVLGSLRDARARKAAALADEARVLDLLQRVRLAEKMARG